MQFTWITVDPDLMGGVPTVRGLRILLKRGMGVERTAPGGDLGLESVAHAGFDDQVPRVAEGGFEPRHSNAGAFLAVQSCGYALDACVSA
jgi:hypothetical protein